MKTITYYRTQCSWFTRFAGSTARLAGHPATFGIAIAVVGIWAACGPIFHFSDTWQLIINTSTTIITFLMVFLIQNTQNRDSHAVHVKLDELIRAIEGANNALLDVEELDEKQIGVMRETFEKLAADARDKLGADQSVSDVPANEKAAGRDRPAAV